MLRNIALIIFVSVCSFTTRKSHKVSPDSGRVEILFLGHKSKHHDSEKLADILSRELFKDGFNITYSTNPDDLNEATLGAYDGLMLYANYDSISSSQEAALLGFVRNGKGFIPIHCASFCFRNSPEVVELIGGQFKSHKWDSFPAVITKPDHPVTRGIPAFFTTDETYVHEKISNNITVLTERVEGAHREPYTWIREFGSGRVFYTAYGHDDHTFNNKDFVQLIRNGTKWAVGDKAMTRLAQYGIPEAKYSDAKIPNYERRDPAPRYQHPMTPEESMKLTQVPTGFELQLFASEPDIINPIYMNWDERGRLWVIETVDYPNTVREDKEQGDDRIKIMEDTDGDGKADKSTIFAEKLNIPTSFVFANGGIVVSQAPYFLFLKDSNGDDQADIKDTLFTGWGTFDTHAGPSNLRYGLDNRIWGVVGYSGFRGKVDKDSIQFSSGLYRLDLNGKNLEFLATTSNNTWGLGFSEEFDVFISTANNTHSGYFSIPQKYLRKAGIRDIGVEKLDGHYAMHVVTKNLRQVDVHGGFTAAAGHSLYTARQFPKEYWNRVAFVTEPTGRVIHKHILERTGSGFVEKEDGWNVLASADEWAGPVQAEVGPDGSLWILDWYDFIIQHNPTPEGFENGQGNAYVIPLRDHERGRIYKLKYKNAKAHTLRKLDKSNPAQLVEALADDNMFWRTTAQRLLVESKDKSVFPSLYKMAADEGLDEAGLNPGAIHALWTLHGLNAFDGSNAQAIAIATKALQHPSAGVRRAAIMVLPRNAATASALSKNKVFNDKDLRVRLAAILATADMKASDQLGNTLFDMAGKSENAGDPRLTRALLAATSVHQKGFKDAMKKKGLSDNPSLGQISLVQRMGLSERLSSIDLRYNLNEPPSGSPDVLNKELLVTGDLEKGRAPEFSGVIVAHGDRQNGYAVYMEKSRLNFVVNQNGKAYTIKSPDTISSPSRFTAILLKTGTMKLLINNKQVATGKAPGLYKKMLDEGIRVGFDSKKGDEKVALYPDEFRTRNVVRNIRLETLQPLEKTAAEALASPDRVITINVVKNVMKFDKELVTVKAGSTIHLVLNNPDFMQHNLVLIKPNTSQKVGLAADKLATDPNGAKLNYVPRMPEVLQATPLVNPEGKFVLKFKVPDAPGDYPYLCTFPGHWRIMNGILRVTK